MERFLLTGPMILPRLSDFVFFGTDEFSVATLAELKKLEVLPTLIITAPDKPRGRKLLLTPPPVKLWAEENKIPYRQPKNLRSANIRSDLKEISRSGLGLVAAYGQIIPPSIFNLPKYGTLNIHPSLLPKYRGPTPIQNAILAGEKETGVTIMLIDEQIDHGPTLKAKSLKLKDKNYIEIRDELAREGARLFVKLLPDWLAGKIVPQPQNHQSATYTKKFKKEDGEINLSQDDTLGDKGVVLYRKFLAYQPWPGIYFITKRNSQDQRVIITAARLEHNRFIIDRVKPEGKNEMSWPDFQRGFK